jgi:phosphoglycolate phosphatase
MKYKAVIFDLDGTLLDTIDDIADSTNKALETYGYPQFSVDEYKYFVGKGVDHLIKSVIKAGNIEEEAFVKIKEKYFEIYEKQGLINTKIYKGINELLNYLLEKKISINILSNKPQIQTDKVIDYYFDKNIFTLVYGKKVEFLPKPDPSSANDLVKKLGLDAKDVLYVGDTETDIFTAKNASFESVGVLWGFRKRTELVNAGADYIVEEPSEIVALLSR